MRSSSTTDITRGIYGLDNVDRERQSQSGVTSPNAFQNIKDRLEIPGQGGPNGDFATGYSLGLIGGVRSWVSDQHS